MGKMFSKIISDLRKEIDRLENVINKRKPMNKLTKQALRILLDQAQAKLDQTLLCEKIAEEGNKSEQMSAGAIPNDVDNQSVPSENISLCKECFCMTRDIKGKIGIIKCGKCGEFK
jgi:hypothetical protein